MGVAQRRQGMTAWGCATNRGGGSECRPGWGCCADPQRRSGWSPRGSAGRHRGASRPRQHVPGDPAHTHGGGLRASPKISPWASCAKVFIKTPVGTGGVPWPAGNGKPHHPPPGVRGPGSAERKNGQSQAGPPNNNWKTSDRGVKKKAFLSGFSPNFWETSNPAGLGLFFWLFSGEQPVGKRCWLTEPPSG